MISKIVQALDIAMLMDRSVAAIDLRIVDIDAISNPDKNLPGFGRSSELLWAWKQNSTLPKDLIDGQIFHPHAAGIPQQVDIAVPSMPERWQNNLDAIAVTWEDAHSQPGY